MMKTSSATDKQKSKITLPSLYAWNMSFAIAHAAQGFIILLLSATKLLPVQTSYLTHDPVASELAGSSVMTIATKHLFDLNLAYVVASFFFVAAIVHAVLASIYRKQYEADLKKRVNRSRWIEYGLGGGLVLTAIATLSGVTELSTLIMIFALKLVMDLICLVTELTTQGKTKLSWLGWAVAVFAGIVPWIVLAVAAWGSGVYGTGLPGYVWGLYATAVLLCVALTANTYMLYKKSGKWKDYLYGERLYMIITFAGKTLIAWQIFAGALIS